MNTGVSRKPDTLHEPLYKNAPGSLNDKSLLH